MKIHENILGGFTENSARLVVDRRRKLVQNYESRDIFTSPNITNHNITTRIDINMETIKNVANVAIEAVKSASGQEIQNMNSPSYPRDDQETKLDPAPLYDGPFYKGSGKLKGKKAIITGGDSGIGRAVSVFFAREGCDVSIVYFHSMEDAEETVRLVQKEGAKGVTFQGEMTSSSFHYRHFRCT